MDTIQTLEYDVSSMGLEQDLSKAEEESAVVQEVSEEPPIQPPVDPEPVIPEPVVSEPALPEQVVSEPVVPEPALPEQVVSEPVVPEPFVEDPTGFKASSDDALNKNLSEAFDKVAETPALPEQPSLRNETPEDWKDVPAISREQQGMKPKGRPPKRKAQKGVEAEKDEKKKPKASKTSSGSKEKDVEPDDVKAKGKRGEKKTKTEKAQADGEKPASSKKSKQELKAEEGEKKKKKQKTSEKEKVEAEGSFKTDHLPLGTTGLFTINNAKDLESKFPQNDTKYTMMDWHLQFLVAQNGKTVFRFVDEHLKLDGVPLASDYPLTVCKGEVPGKDQEKEDRKREQRAKISRKSAAYHRARKAVIEQGGTDQEAKAAGKEARLFCLCSCIFSHSPSSTMKLTTSARPTKIRSDC